MVAVAAADSAAGAAVLLVAALPVPGRPGAVGFGDAVDELVPVGVGDVAAAAVVVAAPAAAAAGERIAEPSEPRLDVDPVASMDVSD